MAKSQTPEDPAEEPENIRLLLAHFHQSEQARLDRAKSKLRTEILPALAQHRVASIEAAYSGYGDSGAIDGTQFRDPAGQRIDRATIPSAILEQLENAIYEFLPSGFENNEGGQGTLTIVVEAASVKIAHSQNYTQTTDTTEEFTLQ